MRYVFAVLMCLMLLFMGVQYNDPDGVMWIAIYAIPALWCALAAFRGNAFSHAITRYALLASIIACGAGVIWFWPLTPRFWTKEVWYNVETAREGMGLMIVAAILGLVLFAQRKRFTSVNDQ